MNELDKMARELLSGGHPRKPGFTVTRRQAELAIRAALLTAPPGWKLVPVPPTDEMIDAAQDAHMPFGDMHFAITSAILAAPEPK